METQDTHSPYVEHKDLKVIFVADNSFSIRWEKAKDKETPTWLIRYVVAIKETDNPDDTWHIVQGLDIDSFTFTDLKSYTRYSCVVLAYDEDGHVTAYPGVDSCLTVTTRWNRPSPTAPDSTIKVTEVKQHSISIQWKMASDEITEEKDILYMPIIGEKGVRGSSMIVHEEKGICNYTFTGLKMGTIYTISIWAVDQANHMMIYPNFDGMDVRTLGPDNSAPTIKNKGIVVTDVQAHSISIKWEKATDNVTLQKDLLYSIILKEADADPHEPATTIYEEKGICAYTIRDLKSNTSYRINVAVKDENSHITYYYKVHTGIIVTTLEDDFSDTLAPTVQNRQIRVVDTTNHSISIRWDEATDDTTHWSDIEYLVGIRKSCSMDTWHIDRKGKGFNTHTFQNLKPGLSYEIFIKAYDKAGNLLQYPSPDAYLTVHTKEGDNQAPTAPSKYLTVMDVTETSIAIEWEPAKDNVTQDKDIRYVVALTKADDKEDPWRIVHQGTGFHKFTFKDLKPGTRYSFFVMAFDEAGNMIQYPGLDRSVTVETLSW